MRAHGLQLSFVVFLGCALTAGAGCGGDNHQGAGTGGQSGSGGSTGTAGGGGGDAGGGGAGDGGAGGGAAGVSACATSTGATGTGGGVEQSPQQIHDALLNAPTVGGINVARTPPTASYPTCQ